MATIQVRNVPDHVHRVYRRRAAAAGMSLQEYVLAVLEQNASVRSPAEVIAEIEAEMAREGVNGYTTMPAADIIRADRDSR